MPYIGLLCQGFGRGWAAEVASRRGCQKLPPTGGREVPGKFKDPPLIKAESSNDISSMSVTTYLRKS